MAMTVKEIFDAKFREIQSRLPIKMNTPNDTAVNFQNVLDNVTSTSNSISSSKNPSIDNAIAAAANKYNIDPNLIKAVIKAESGFNPTAVSKAGAQGLMQLMPSTAAGLGVTNPFDINQNIDAGTRYLKDKINQFGDIRLGVAAYNAGPGSVIKYNGIPPYTETQNYVKTVLKNYEEYSQK